MLVHNLSRIIALKTIMPYHYREYYYISPNLGVSGVVTRLGVGITVVELEVRSRGPTQVSHTGQKTFLPSGEMDLE